MKGRAQLLVRIAMIVFAASSISFTLMSRTDADPPSCASFNDPGCVFGENFENGTLNGWAKNATATTEAMNVAPGLNGTGRKLLQRIPADLGSSWIDTSLGGFVTTSGQTIWVEWYGGFDINYRWNSGCAAQDCSTGAIDWSHKNFDLRNDGPGGSGRVLFAPQGINNGLNATPRMYFMADPEASPPASGHFFFESSSFLLEPGRVYHYVIQITSGYKPSVSASSVGAFKMWINETLVYDFSNVGTCGNTSGACIWQYILLGGQGENVGVGGNIFYHDQVRITRTNIAPSGVTANAPSNILVR